MRKRLNINNLLDFGFPIYLIIFEFSIRLISSSTDRSDFVGPALAVTGLGLLVNIVKPKKIALSDEDKAYFSSKGVVIDSIRTQKDENLSTVGWVLILIELLGWYWCCEMTFSNEKNHINSFVSYLPLFIGLIIYFLGVILVTVKEKL